MSYSRTLRAGKAMNVAGHGLRPAATRLPHDKVRERGL